MSVKSLIIIVVILAAVLWYIFWGPQGCNLLEESKNRGVNEDLLPWVKDNIDASWLHDQPETQTIEVEKIHIFELVPTGVNLIDDAQVSIKGYYIAVQSERKVRYNITRKIIVDRNTSPVSFRLP